MNEWFETFRQDWWLRGDETGQDEADFIRRTLRLRKGQHVLDCPCGAGRIAFHLARAGCHVTGVDRVAAFIRRMRRRFEAVGLDGQFLALDMRRIAFEEEFDAAVNYWGSFGYFDDRQNLEFLRALARAVKPGGRVLVDQVNRERILRRFRPRMEHGPVVTYPRWNARTQRVTARWTRRGRTESRSSIRLYTLGQMRALFERAGLAVEVVYGDADGSDYGRSSRRMVVIGRKPG